MLHTRKAQTEESHAAMAARNDRRLEIVKRKLGVKYAHHPVNQVQRRDSSENVAQLVDRFMSQRL